MSYSKGAFWAELLSPFLSRLSLHSFFPDLPAVCVRKAGMRTLAQIARRRLSHCRLHGCWVDVLSKLCAEGLWFLPSCLKRNVILHHWYIKVRDQRQLELSARSLLSRLNIFVSPFCIPSTERTSRASDSDLDGVSRHLYLRCKSVAYKIVWKWCSLKFTSDKCFQTRSRSSTFICFDAPCVASHLFSRQSFTSLAQTMCLLSVDSIKW